MLWIPATTLAQEGQDKSIPQMEVQGNTGDRDEKSYRNMLAAMDVFAANHGLAPSVEAKMPRVLK